MTKVLAKLVDEYERNLNYQGYSRQPRHWDSRLDEIEDEILDRLERMSENDPDFDRIISIIEKRYAAYLVA